MKALDLSFGADLSESHSKIFNNLAKLKIKSFNFRLNIQRKLPRYKKF